ncbi:glycosyltransferase family 2 protein [Bacteroides ihuae]|uniref:glycosyltransferase family 2 protein n=1 Tax=Bacteroides ihuae TaxID=1852362 RepID=UPI0008D9A3E0|nr:glycosyltransferase family 2 protein [Bacteroides ihuae]
MYEVTIGMPLYNAEKYIKQSIESALNQTFESIEFLIIDDKGTDNSVNIVQDIQRQHERGEAIRIVAHDRNRGVAAARNTILKEAKGNYLFFQDSDDLITPDCIEILYKSIKETDSEATYSSYEEISDKNSKKHILPQLIFDGDDQLAAFMNENLRINLRSLFIWNILFRTSFLHKTQLEFKSIISGEDELFSFDIVPFIKKATFLPNVTYTYVKHQGSLSQYQARNKIPLEEIMERMYVRNYCKTKSIIFKNKPYYENVVTKSTKQCFDAAAVIIDKRNFIEPKVQFFSIKELLNHPLPLTEIANFKKYKMLNLCFYVFSKLPNPIINILLLSYIKLLKTYRKRNKTTS